VSIKLGQIKYELLRYWTQIRIQLILFSWLKLWYPNHQISDIVNKCKEFITIVYFCYTWDNIHNDGVEFFSNQITIGSNDVVYTFCCILYVLYVFTNIWHMLPFTIFLLFWRNYKIENVLKGCNKHFYNT